MSSVSDMTLSIQGLRVGELEIIFSDFAGSHGSQVSTLPLNYTLQLVPERGFYFYFFA